jgi:Activator of Hsp90 ATPase homolog 1-like protein
MSGPSMSGPAMSGPSMSAALCLSLVVQCRPERAFRLWTEEIGRWWPADHTVTGDPAMVAFEGRVGGRIYERGRDGTEHDWGEVTVWDPPSRLGYTWHLGGRTEAATDVEIGFVAGDGDATIVEIEHRGWERLGDQAGAWRDRNRAGWESLLPYLAAAAAVAGSAVEHGHRLGTERDITR